MFGMRIRELLFEMRIETWVSADLFPGGGEGARTYFLPKMQQKHTIYIKKSKNIVFLAGLGQPGGTRALFAPLSGRPWIEVSPFAVLLNMNGVR